MIVVVVVYLESGDGEGGGGGITSADDVHHNTNEALFLAVAYKTAAALPSIIHSHQSPTRARAFFDSRGIEIIIIIIVAHCIVSECATS